jgi:hypothetical protein
MHAKDGRERHHAKCQDAGYRSLFVAAPKFRQTVRFEPSKSARLQKYHEAEG